MLENHLVETEFKSETLILEYESAKADLEKINDYVASGAIFRSKVRWSEEGGKNTSYFLSLNDVLDELHRMQKEFLWQGKRAKIKYSTMIGSYEKGGPKDVDLESKFQL